MTGDSSNLREALDPTHCVSYRLRRAARLAAKSYDAALKTTGLKNTQFTLLAALATEGAVSIGALSDLLATDGTTLTRNLEVLVRRGLVKDCASDDARVRTVQLSKKGRNKYQEALPFWQAAQQQVLTGLGAEQWRELEGVLRQIEDACHSLE
ncbi:MarR family winged helix-turn-helix transcriptional regulator [Pelagibius sp. Alg239-R121]|uniref:MarR family winged helix-turn-helix transcriptional regulator n=1 Tax=Pelagibius sp. Alg239-R121 TaxID=2993448 RepID=UPI0024A686F5|nr:MarR family winged helix-turn-helix transcriptional regulator [Pelagibius sp. Alg239-R121]